MFYEFIALLSFIKQVVATFLSSEVFFCLEIISRVLCNWDYVVCLFYQTPFAQHSNSFSFVYCCIVFHCMDIPHFICAFGSLQFFGY